MYRWTWVLLFLPLAGCGQEPALRLVDLLGGRPVEGRPSLSLSYRPYVPGSWPKGKDAGRADALLASLEPHAKMAMSLARGDKVDIDVARRAAASYPDGWERENDLGLVDLAGGKPELALERFDRAIKLAPGRPEPSFNLALTLEELQLDELAVEQWKKVAEAKEPGWSDEAVGRVARLETPPTAMDLGSRKDALRDRFLEARKPADLDPLRTEAAAIAAEGDPIPMRELEYLGALAPEQWAPRNDLAQALPLLRKRVLAREKIDDYPRFIDDPEPMVALWALHMQRFDLIKKGEDVEARRNISRVLELCRTLGCVEESAMATSDLGTIYGNDQDYQAAAAEYRTASSVLERAYALRAAEMLRKQAALDRELGQVAAGLGQGREAIRILRPVSDPSARAALSEAIRAAGNLAGEASFFEAEEAYFTDAIRVAPHPYLRFDGVLRLAARRVARGATAPAISMLEEELESWNDSSEQRPYRSRVQAGLAVALLKAGRVAEAVVHAEVATELARTESELLRIDPLEALARARLESGDARGALAAAQELTRIEHRDQRDRSSRQTNSWTVDRQVLHARALVATGRVDDAFELIAGERGELEDDECRIVFAADHDVLLVLSATAQGVKAEAIRPTTEDIERSLRLLLRRGVDLGELRRLGSPWSEHRCPDTATRVAFVQNDYTLQLPLAQLAKEERPNAVVAVNLRPSSPWPGPVKVRSALFVGDPLGEHASLPAARIESAALRSAFPAVQELTGADATLEQVRSALGQHDLLHLAVHAESMAPPAGASRLVLTGDESLRASDIASMTLDREPLVVLTACAVLGPPGLDAEGGALAGAFIKARARAVVATSRPLEDTAAAIYSEALYSSLEQGLPLWRSHQAATEAVARAGMTDAANALTLVF